MIDPIPERDAFVAYVRRQLVGPFDGPQEVIFDPPNRRYLMGILFPRNITFGTHLETEGEEEDVVTAQAGEENQYSDDPVSAANDFLPASQGLSFFTTATKLTVHARAAGYQTLTGRAAEEATVAAEAVGGPTVRQVSDPRPGRRESSRLWRRTPLPEQEVTVSETTPGPVPLWGDRAEIHVRWRSYPHGSLITATIVNTRTCVDEHPERQWDDMLLQVELEVHVADGEILEYPTVAMSSPDPEEEELRLVHRAARVYAIGHGCSPEWDPTAELVTGLRSEVMPSVVVPHVSPKGPPARALDVAWLANRDVPGEDLVAALDAFINPYEQWIESVEAQGDELTRPAHRQAAAPVTARLRRALARMRDGARVFADSPDRDLLLLAFRLANKAMLIQMRHGAADLAGRRHPRAQAPDMPAAYPEGAAWHPFQLGFFLTTVRGLVEAEHPDRDVVDLIWFPTGGGKTEAYLLVAAFEIFRRRLLHGDSGSGAAVISRFTLSLLTADQFKRTASTTAACEYLRRREPDRLGTEPISVGLWVGEATSPNRYVKARESFEDLRDSVETDERFLLDRCPWCGCEIVPRAHDADDTLYGITATDRSFAFNCPSPKCEFHGHIPVQVVDDGLYDLPPTFLLGTVDKFAQLAWQPRAGALFGTETGVHPPGLIIQDELHLLTGPLGTTMGLYEAAINLLCEHDGHPPKVISSTATIRRAGAQINGLFGRPVDLFPPSGIDADSSYFATVDTSRPGRRYVGLMAQGHTSDTAVVHTGTALLQAPVDLGLQGPARDAYWTVVAYHSSLRELGRTVTIARDDIRSRLAALIRERPHREYEVEELSSSVPRAQQPRLLERLGLDVTHEDVIDFLATTNMLSVGVDVQRLGLMLVNGQPKATAEYIQATSRVGRSAKAPGLIFGLFRSTKPRDRSHYENFRAYHSALYRHVEPTSVTPFSPPSRDRALHAALVILVRHRLGLSSDAAAGRILDHLDHVRALARALVEVVGRVEPRERSGAQAYLDRFIDDWVELAEQARADDRNLYYEPNGRGQTNLLKHFHQRAQGWPTLGSMRNVDHESLIEVARPSGTGQGA